MPPRIRDLINQLKKNGFVDRGGKGSHRNFRHPAGLNITISGKAGDDAKQYQVQDVKQVIKRVSDEKS